MTKIGLKLWNTNVENYLPEAKKLYNSGVFDFIELYVVPGNLDKISAWKNLTIPFDIHAPHFAHSMNLSQQEYYTNNMKFYDETKQYADELNANCIVFHAGTNGNYKETAQQLKRLKEPRAIIENKPFKLVPFLQGTSYVGASFEEIQHIMNFTGCGFCLDICHAICAANSFNMNIYDSIKKWITLNPTRIHISDIDITTEIDQHLHIHEGTVDFERLFSIFPKGVPITLETQKKYQTHLSDFVEDVYNIKKFITL